MKVQRKYAEQTAKTKQIERKEEVHMKAQQRKTALQLITREYNGLQEYRRDKKQPYRFRTTQDIAVYLRDNLTEEAKDELATAVQVIRKHTMGIATQQDPDKTLHYSMRSNQWHKDNKAKQAKQQEYQSIKQQGQGTHRAISKELFKQMLEENMEEQ